MVTTRKANTPARQIRCPRCHAAPGALCLSSVSGDLLTGLHLQRILRARRAVWAAFEFYGLERPASLAALSRERSGSAPLALALARRGKPPARVQSPTAESEIR